MSNLILVIGDPGTGKSTALNRLPVDATELINVVGKKLPFPNTYEVGKNDLHLPDASAILAEMDNVNKKKLHIKNLVIDDAQYIMAIEFMQKAFVKGFDKFSVMAKNIWDILILSNRLRDDLKIFVIAHADEVEGVRMMKTLGKLLREKLTPEGLSTIVLFADVVGEEERTYFFQTQNDGKTIAKSPMGMFPMYIPNDLQLVSERVDEYYKGVSLEKSVLNFGNITRRK